MQASKTALQIFEQRVVLFRLATEVECLSGAGFAPAEKRSAT